MSDDRTRDSAKGRLPEDVHQLFPGGESRQPEHDTESDPLDSESALPPPLDVEAVERHRAAKQERQKRRREQLALDEGVDPEDSGRGAGRGDGRGKGRGGGGGGRGGGGGGKGKGKGSALPAMRPDIKPDTPALRAERVEAIRRDLVRRRRRKGSGLLLKLAFFVLIPTLAVGYFLWFSASDMYKSEAIFMVQSADGGGGGAGSSMLSSLIGGGGGNDPVAVQNYVSSRDVLRLLDAEQAWIAHFQAPTLDYFNRLKPDASFEEAFRHYEEMVTVTFDPTEGIIEMEIVAADPDTAERFSKSIITYAERMVDELSSRIREDAIRDAERNLRDAESDLKAAQLAEAEVRKKLEIYSVEGEVTAQMGLITRMEGELEELIGRLTNLRRVTSETDPRVERISNQVDTLQKRIESRRALITGAKDRDQTSLTDVSAEMTRAQIDVSTALAIFTAAIEAREVARLNAARQHRYLSVVSSPSLPDEPNYPRKPEMLALAFICFLGLYIIGALTVSLVREQASI